MFVSERSLLVGVTFNTSRIRAGCEPRLFQLKTTVRIMTIAATYRAFENFMMERLVEVRLDLVMTADAKLRFSDR